MREMNGEFYGRPEWPGKVFLTLRGLLPERAMYVCHTKSTDLQAIPAGKVLAPIDGEFRIEAHGWKALSETGEVLHLPLKDEKRPLTDWEEECEEVTVAPGQLAAIKIDTPHRLHGAGRSAMLYAGPESRVGQGLLNRGDYKTGVVVIDPPKSRMRDVLARLSALSTARRGGVAETEATAVYSLIMSLATPAAAWQTLEADIREGIRAIRNRCRLKRFQCELNTHVTLRDLEKVTGWDLKKIEKVFREKLMTRPCIYVRFLRQIAAMQFYAFEQLSALPEKVDISITELAAEVHKDAAKFTRHFHRFFGISPVMFYRNTDFFVIQLEAN
jgi:AraC-like DNA-binding protein